ncbi:MULTISPECIES: hypothetical protein [unclassified Achromobacter]|uniref:hypothetical protein n=1 Tax=unclassified Achromobacter TaxID=2626865 RepID=UPI0011785CBD|nr:MULTISPECIES: hypothetical protein [unclassified Achromobacter]
MSSASDRAVPTGSPGDRPSLNWHDTKAFRASWTRPRDIDDLPPATRIEFRTMHSPDGVLRVHDGTRLFRLAPPDALMADGKAIVAAEDGQTEILNHLQWVARDRVLESVVSIHAMEQYVGVAVSPDDGVNELASLKQSAWLKPPRMMAGDISANCLKVSHTRPSWGEAVEHPDFVQVETTLGELRAQGAQFFLLSVPEPHGRAKAKKAFNRLRGKPPARHDKRQLMVVLPEGMGSVTMEKSGSG